MKCAVEFGDKIIVSSRFTRQPPCLEFNLGWFVAPSRWDLFNQLLKRMDDERDWWPKPAEIQATAKANFNPEKQLDKLIEYLNQ